jgi:hypothetical protein
MPRTDMPLETTQAMILAMATMKVTLETMTGNTVLESGRVAPYVDMPSDTALGKSLGESLLLETLGKLVSCLVKKSLFKSLGE